MERLITAVPASQLPEQKLLGEFADVQITLDAMRKMASAGTRPDSLPIPDEYSADESTEYLVNRGAYLLRRLQDLSSEMRRRGYGFKNFHPEDFVEGLGHEWMLDWAPSPSEVSAGRVAHGLGAPVFGRFRSSLPTPQQGPKP